MVAHIHVAKALAYRALSTEFALAAAWATASAVPSGRLQPTRCGSSADRRNTGTGERVLSAAEVFPLSLDIECRRADFAGPRHAQYVPSFDFTVVARRCKNIGVSCYADAPACLLMGGYRLGKSAFSQEVPKMESPAPVDHGERHFVRQERYVSSTSTVASEVRLPFTRRYVPQRNHLITRCHCQGTPVWTKCDAPNHVANDIKGAHERIAGKIENMHVPICRCHSQKRAVGRNSGTGDLISDFRVVTNWISGCSVEYLDASVMGFDDALAVECEAQPPSGATATRPSKFQRTAFDIPNSDLARSVTGHQSAAVGREGQAQTSC